MLFKITLLSSFVPFPLFYVNDVLNIVIYFPVLQDYYIFSFDFHILIPVLPTKRATRGRKRAKRVKWKSNRKIKEISEASKQEISEAR
jgi:hypothetical protein